MCWSSPVAPTAAPKLNAPPVITKEARGSLAPDLRATCATTFFLRVAHYANDFLTAFASLAGLPALSVPFGRTSGGLPVGVQVVQRPDVRLLLLLRTARRLELIRDDAPVAPALRDWDVLREDGPPTSGMPAAPPPSPRARARLLSVFQNGASIARAR